MSRSMCGAKIQPAAANNKPAAKKTVIAVPMIRRTDSISRRPIFWPINIVVAMVKPNNVENIKNMMSPAFADAASASSPRNFPIQTELTELLIDWRMFTPSEGSANNNNVLATGPTVRSR